MHKKESFRVAWVGAKGTLTAGQIGLSAVEPTSTLWDDVLPTKDRHPGEAAPVIPMRTMAAHGA